MKQKVQIEKEAEKPSPHAAQQPQVLFAYSYYPHCALPQGKKGRGKAPFFSFLLPLLPFFCFFCCCPSCLPVVVTLRVFSAFVCHCVGSHTTPTTSYNMRNLRGSTSNKLHSNKAEKVHEAVQEQQKENFHS